MDNTLYDRLYELLEQQGEVIEALGKAHEALCRSHEVLGEIVKRLIATDPARLN
jgi:hypothetical protein